MSPAQSRNLRRDLADLKLASEIRTRLMFSVLHGAEETIRRMKLDVSEHDASLASIEAEAADEREGVAA